MNKVHLTKPQEFICFGCIDTKSERDNEQDTSRRILGIRMAWLH